MTPGQRLAVGFAIGGVITLLIHPGSRGFLLYALNPKPVEARIDKNPLRDEPITLPPPENVAEMPEYDLYATAHALTRILNRKAGRDIRQDDFLTASRFLLDAELRDPDNAYWPQLSAALEARWGDIDIAKDHGRNAATRLRWRNGVAQQVDRLWSDVEEAEGVRFAWQGLYSLTFRQSDPAIFITTSAANLLNDSIQSRYLTVVNAGLMLAGATSLDTGRHAVDLLDQAAMFGLDVDPTRDPRGAEQRRSEFIEAVRQGLGDSAASTVNRELRRAEGWRSLIRPDREIMRQRTVVNTSAILTATAPSSAFAASFIMGMLALLGLATVGAFASVPHPDPRIFYLLGIVGGGVLLVLTGAWLLAAWCVILGFLLGYPSRISRLDPVETGPLPRSLAMVFAVVALLLVSLHFATLAPPAIHLGVSWFTRLPWASLAFIVISLVIPYSVLWARARERSAVLTAGETLALLGAIGAFIGILAAVVLTPVAIWEDSRNRALVDRWVSNEPQAFEVISP